MSKTVIAVFIQPPSSLNDKILLLQEKLGKITGSSFNLVFPPHITMRSGLEVPENKLDEIIASFADVIKQMPKPLIKITKIDFSESADMGCGYWIGLDVDKNDELDLIFDKLQSKFTEFDGFPNLSECRPHFSLAFNDLTKEGFEKAKKYLEGVDLSELFVEFELDFITVFTSDNNRKEWKLKEKLYFN